jgi:hypothetical protein
VWRGDTMLLALFNHPTSIFGAPRKQLGADPSARAHLPEAALHNHREEAPQSYCVYSIKVADGTGRESDRM